MVFVVYNASRHMMTSSNGNIFRVTGPLCGKFTGHGEFPAQRPVTRSFDVFFDLRLNKRQSKQWWGWRIETPPRPLWPHCNEKDIVKGNVNTRQKITPKRKQCGHSLYVLRLFFGYVYVVHRPVEKRTMDWVYLPNSLWWTFDSECNGCDALLDGPRDLFTMHC